MSYCRTESLLPLAALVNIEVDFDLAAPRPRNVPVSAGLLSFTPPAKRRRVDPDVPIEDNAEPGCAPSLSECQRWHERLVLYSTTRKVYAFPIEPPVRELTMPGSKNAYSPGDSLAGNTTL